MTKVLLILIFSLLQSCNDEGTSRNERDDNDHQLSEDLESTNHINHHNGEQEERHKVEGMRLFVDGVISDEKFLSYFKYPNISDEKKKQILIMLVAQMFSDEGDTISLSGTPFLHKEIKRLFPASSRAAENQNGHISGKKFVAQTIPKK